MTAILQELKRRNVLRAAGAYVALSWLVLQVAETLLPVFGLEDAVLRTLLIVLGIGFLPAVALAWAFELTPAGLVRDADVDRSSSESRRMDKRLDRVLVVVLALAVAYFAVDKFVLDPARDHAREAAIAEAALADDADDVASTGPSTLAVLPFIAVGDAEDSRFFAAGVHDDLLTRLAKLGSLRVISRTSVMEYRDTTRNLREIGEALGADAILEGGVQTAGNRIRINAQLIEAATDEHLWAETFDRELTTENIFDVQADISQAIAKALKATIDEAASDRLVPTDNMAAYRAFHESQALRSKKNRAVLTDEYQNLLRQALELDPNFTRAAAELVGAISFAIFGGRESAGELAEAERLLARLQATAPDSADHLIAQSYYTYYVLKDYDLAGGIITRAQQGAPSDLQLLSLKAWIQRRQGDFEGMLETRRLQRTLDPGEASYSRSIAGTLQQLHRYDEALAEARAHSHRSPRIEYLRHQLEVIEHRDLRRRAADIAEMREATGIPPIEFVAEHFVEAREYAAALELLDGVEEPYATARTSNLAISSVDMRALEAYWLGDDIEALDAMLPETVAAFEEHRDDENLTSLLGEALLAALGRDYKAAEYAIARWLRQSTVDPASRAGDFPYACRMLGLARAAEAAVDCIRRGLSEPSRVTPFIDPLFPHYDAVRDSDAFQALLAEIGMDP